MLRTVRVALVLISLVAAPNAAFANPEVKRFTAHLTGANEVPPVATDAVGQAIFKLESATSMNYRLIVDEIENVVAAHIHCGEAGQNGPVAIGLYGPASPGGGPVEGVLATGNFNPSGLSCTFGGITVSLLDAMRAGKTYTNVHTNDGVTPPNTGAGDMASGEIRGQNQPRG